MVGQAIYFYPKIGYVLCKKSKFCPNELQNLNLLAAIYYKLKLLTYRLPYPQFCYRNFVSARLQTLEIDVPITLVRQLALSASAYKTEEALSVNSRP